MRTLSILPPFADLINEIIDVYKRSQKIEQIKDKSEQKYTGYVFMKIYGYSL